MQLASFLPHYQLVCISFDISSFSLISYYKRRVVLPQTTCCFTINDVLFCYKRRVVSLKMNMCFWGCCDTCDSKKQKSCKMRVCYARVYVCVARGEDRLRIIDSFCSVYVAKMWVGNLETPFFCRFFTLLPHIYPYSIGGENIRQRIWNKVGIQITISSKMLILKRKSERKITFSTLLLRSFLEVR